MLQGLERTSAALSSIRSKYMNELIEDDLHKRGIDSIVPSFYKFIGGCLLHVKESKGTLPESRHCVALAFSRSN